MNNLGTYQWMTTIAKKVGGPINLLLLAGTTGAILYKGGEVATKKCINAVKKSQYFKENVYEHKNDYNAIAATYTVLEV